MEKKKRQKAKSEKWKAVTKCMLGIICIHQFICMVFIKNIIFLGNFYMKCVLKMFLKS